MRRYKYQLDYNETDEIDYDFETVWDEENLKKIIGSLQVWNMAFIYLYILCTMDLAKDFDSSENL